MLNKDNRLATFQKEGSITTDFVINSIEKWLETVSKPTVLVLDNAPIHQEKAFLARLAQWQEKNLFIFFLPAYCPHLNKIEILWRRMKYEWLRPHDYFSFESLTTAIKEILSNLGTQYKISFRDRAFIK